VPDSLLDLEKRRSEVLAEISALGDFRPGSISATGGRCGTPACHCHKPGDTGHGPNVRLTYKAGGKTVTESFSSLAAQRKAERELESFRRYQELSRAYVEVNAHICRARPVEDSLSPQEKNG
jgi:hypothetical protein